MQDGLVNITGLNKVELLRALCAHAFRSPWGASSVFDELTAQHAVKQYIDYFQGYAIKSDLSGDSVDSRLYDRDAGTGMFQTVVDTMRSKE